MKDDAKMAGDKLPANKETIRFVESYEPPIQAGTYKLTVEQKVTGPGINETHTDTKKVYVRGERFSLDPLDIASVFPPDRNQGDHFNVLPHIVFSRKTLPWERRIGVPEGGQNHAPPWLALLIFHDDDPPPAIQTLTVGDLKGDSGKGIVSYDDAYKKTYSNPPRPWAPEPGENLQDPCLVVDIPVDLLSAIAPTKEDLGWLAHSREVLREQEPGTLASADETPLGEYSVIIANRLPKMGGVSTACLVSLEGMEAFLPLDSGASPNLGPGARFVRLAVLKTWSFSCTAAHETFKGSFQNLTYGPLQLSYTPPDFTPPSPTSDELAAESAVKNALAMGYAALNHHTRWGDQTISWYRGPLLPYKTPPEVLPPPAPLSTADAALRYDPELGMLDVSYAAAWQLGRLLALRDKSFAYALYQWKQEIARKTFEDHQTSRVNQMPHIQLLRADAPHPLSAEAIRATAFQFVADDLKNILLALDGKDTAK
jgi:hypothetical protein